ncbi:MAG: hypothetical protein Pg6A_14910 [Termitinemataceae bacterium]|nr:MAG: hypothetical protein Pg6A_14910 [Termitinemataceae bacterium]
MIKGIAKLILALNGNVRRTHIAAGFAWGLLFALLPTGIFWIALFVFSLFWTHNHAAKIFVLALVKLCSPFIYPLTDELGWFVLNMEALRPFYTKLYNMPFVPFTRFNNTLVAGGLAAAIVLWFPVYFLIRALVPVYRRTLLPKIANSKLVGAFGRIPLVAKIRNAVNTISTFKEEALSWQ